MPKDLNFIMGDQFSKNNVKEPGFVRFNGSLTHFRVLLCSVFGSVTKLLKSVTWYHVIGFAQFFQQVIENDYFYKTVPQNFDLFPKTEDIVTNVKKIVNLFINSPLVTFKSNCVKTKRSIKKTKHGIFNHVPCSRLPFAAQLKPAPVHTYTFLSEKTQKCTFLSKTNTGSQVSKKSHQFCNLQLSC